MKQDNPFQDNIDDMKKMQEAIRKAAESSEDVKNGDCTPEDEMAEPAVMLFGQILKSSIEMMNNEEVINAYNQVKDKIGEEASKIIFDVMITATTTAAYNAITFYDDLLKQEITKQFDNVGHHINLAKSSIEGHEAVLTVFGKRLTDLENKIKLENLSKENDMK